MVTKAQKVAVTRVPKDAAPKHFKEAAPMKHLEVPKSVSNDRPKTQFHSHYRCGYCQEQGWITCEVNQDAIEAFQCCSINIANGDQSALSHHLQIACTRCNARGET